MRVRCHLCPIIPSNALDLRALGRKSKHTTVSHNHPVVESLPTSTILRLYAHCVSAELRFFSAEHFSSLPSICQLYWALFSALRSIFCLCCVLLSSSKNFSSMLSVFSDMLCIFLLCRVLHGIEGQEAHGPWRSAWEPTWPLAKVQKLHIHSLSIPGGRNWAYFRSMGSGSRDTGRFSKLPYLDMELGHWAKFQKLHIYCLSTQGIDIELIFPQLAAVSEIQADFQNCHIWAWNLAIGQIDRRCT